MNAPTRHRDMASSTPQPRPGQPGRRRRPFSNLMRKLVSLKPGAPSDGSRYSASKRNHLISSIKTRHLSESRNSPAGTTEKTKTQTPEKAKQGAGPDILASRDGPCPSNSRAENESRRVSLEEAKEATDESTSKAPTVSTDLETSRSIVAPSHGASSVTGTSRTANGMESRKGGDSTFSSPAPSVRSLTTTLTTIQSMGPNSALSNGSGGGAPTSHAPPQQSSTQSIHFNQPFPSSATPASAIPPYLMPGGTSGTTTYATATANNLLSDNASILTLASSSKRHRRRSIDTDASVRALAPSSLWGGSRESLPLSVLSSNMDLTVGGPASPGLNRMATGGPGNERASIYSATGLSVRSGLLGAGRAEG